MSGGRGARGVNEYSYQGGEKGAALDLTGRKQLTMLSCGFWRAVRCTLCNFQEKILKRPRQGLGENTIPTSGATDTSASPKSPQSARLCLCPRGGGRATRSSAVLNIQYSSQERPCCMHPAAQGKRSRNQRKADPHQQVRLF